MDSIETNKLNIATKFKLGSTQIKNSVNILANDNVKITKVLTITAKPRIENINVNNMEIKFDGVVDYDVLIVAENNEIIPITQKSNFSHSFENSAITPDTVVSIFSNVLELNNISSSANELVYNTLINFDIYVTSKNKDICCATPIENVFVKEGDFCFCQFDNEIIYDTRLNFEIEKDNKVNSILFATSNACIKSIIPSNGYFVVSGNVYTTVVYRTEEGLIRSLIKENSFSEEIEARGVTKESIIQAQIQTKEIAIIENSEKNVFNIDIPIKIVAQIYNNIFSKCILDAYSTTHEVNLTTNSFNQDEFLTTSCLQDNIITSFSIDNSNQPIDRVLAVVPQNISIVNTVVKKEELVVEGIVNLNIIYYSIDEENADVLNSIDIDVPYSLSFSIQNLDEGEFVIPQICLCDVSVKSKMGKELEILAEVCLNYSVVKDKVSAIVTDLTVGEEKPQKDYALEIYLAKQNQELWDIAKELNVSTEDIINQNQNLSLPISSGERIVVYRQRQVDFN